MFQIDNFWFSFYIDHNLYLKRLRASFSLLNDVTMMLVTLSIVFVSSFIAFAISAICGGGAGLMLIPILGSFLPITQVPAALSIGSFTSSSSRIIVFRQNIYWPIVRWFIPAALPAVFLGAWLLKFVNPLYLEIVLGIFLVSNLPLLFKKQEEVSEVRKLSPLKITCIGFMAGFLSGFTGAVGLLFNKFYFRYGLTKEEIIATRAANEVILHLIKIVLYTLFGLISMKVISVGFSIAVSALLSTWFMKWVLPRLSDLFFKKIGYCAMFVSGFFMLGDSGSHLVVQNGGELLASSKENGIETKLKWLNGEYAFELSYDEGFEFEQVIPISELTEENQQLIKSRHPEADQIVVEVVYAIGSQSYEAYYFKDQVLIEKYDF
ncbi:sulfite exporter TauE/SafE family protein [Leptospira kanakyensis]|nr:sulfite exporter TauE/SafE family protein [Leptospira kanakyensis]